MHQPIPHWLKRCHAPADPTLAQKMPCASRSYIFFLPLFIHLTFGAAACDALRRHTTRSCGVLHVTRSDAEAAVLAAGCAGTSGRMQKQLCCAAGCCAATSGRMQMRLCRAAGCAAAAVGCGCWLSCLCWLCYCCFVVICSLPGWLGWERHRRWRRVARSGACFVTAPCRRSTCPNQACPRLGPTSATPDPKSECWDDIQTCRKGLACMQHAIKRVRTQKSRR